MVLLTVFNRSDLFAGDKVIGGCSIIGGLCIPFLVAFVFLGSGNDSSGHFGQIFRDTNLGELFSLLPVPLLVVYRRFGSALLRV